MRRCRTTSRLDESTRPAKGGVTNSRTARRECEAVEVSEGWPAGSVVVQREVIDDFVWSAIPVRVVEDSADHVVLYRANATVCWWPSHPRTEHKPAAEVTQTGRAWDFMGGLITIAPRELEYSVSLMWHHDNWSFWGWYVDFIRPYRRTSIGFDFTDIHLDLLALADGSIIVKDEDEFNVAIARGEIATDEADRARHTCDDLRAQALAGLGIFASDWPAWRPPSTWTTPSLATGISDRLARAPTPVIEQLDLAAWVGDPIAIRPAAIGDTSYG